MVRIDAASGALLQHITAPHRNGCEALCLDPDRQLVLTGGRCARVGG